MRIFAAREEDAHQGWVWLQDPSLPARCVVKITNPATRTSVYCETLQIEGNFLREYNQSPRVTITNPASSMVIGGWYRASLGGLQTQTDVALEVQRCRGARGWWWRFKACIGHPQIVVRMAAWMGGIGLVVSIIGLALGVASLC
jgi:hypothetical protein